MNFSLIVLAEKSCLFFLIKTASPSVLCTYIDRKSPITIMKVT